MKISMLSILKIAGVAASIALGSASLAQAAAFTWAGPGGTTSAPTSGTWDTTSANWNTSELWVSGANTTVFAGADATAGTYAIDLAVTGATSSISFNNNGYSITAQSAKTITLPNTSTGALQVASGKTADIGTNVTLTSTLGLNIGGTGTLNINSGATIATGGTGFTMGIVGGATVNVNTGGAYIGTIATSNNGINIGGGAGAGTFNVEGGTVTAGGTAGTNGINVGGGSSGSSTMTVNSGTVTISSAATNGLNVGSGSITAAGIFNLNGGTVTAPKVARAGAATGTFNFNGGTLRANASSATFMTGLTTANVKSGGAIIDSNGFNITVGQALLEDGSSTGGGLTKNGTGTLTLSAANTFTGATVVNAGTLQLGAGGSIASSSNLTLNVATFDMNGASAVTLGNFSLLGNSSINFGIGNNALAFSSTDGSWTGILTLTGFDEADSLRIGTSSILTPGQLAEISVAGFQVTGQDGNGFVTFSAVPVPEPSMVLLLGLGGVALLIVRQRVKLS